MAVVNGSGGIGNGGYFKHAWEGLANGDTGKPVGLATFPDRNVQVLGTFGAGGSVSIEGSNDGGTTWAVLKDAQGVALTFTAAGVGYVLANTELIRPNVTGGDVTTALDVILVASE